MAEDCLPPGFYEGPPTRKQSPKLDESAAKNDPIERTINVTNSLYICSEQRERKMCQVDSFCYVSSVVAALSTLPDTG